MNRTFILGFFLASHITTSAMQCFSSVTFVAALEGEAGQGDPFIGTTYWVNPTTVGGAGGTGTSTNINAGASRPFFSLEDCIDTLPDPLTTPVRIYCSGGMDIEPVQQDNWNFKTTSANYIWVIGDNGTGKFDATKYHLSVTNGSAWYNNNIGHGRAWNIHVKLTATTSIGGGLNYTALRWCTANNDNQPVEHEFRNCWVYLVQTGADAANGFATSDPITDDGGYCRLINCGGNGGTSIFVTDGSAWAAVNCTNFNGTAVFSGSGFNDDQVCINCLAHGNTAGDFNATGTSSHANNASSDATANGTALDNSIFTFVDTNTFDFHLHADDLGARGLGLTAPGGALYGDDIDGQTRTVPWDIGADKGEFTTIPTFFADTGTGETAGSATSSVLTSPANIANNHIMIYAIYKGSSAALTLPVGEGWTEATGSPFFNSGGHYTHILWKRSDGSEPATHTFTWTGSAFRYGHCAVFAGCATSGSPFDQEPAAAYKTTSGSNRNYPDISITTAVANTLIFWMGDEDEQATSGTPPTGMVETEDASGGNNPWETAIRNKTTAGSFTATGGSYGGSNVGITSAFIMSLKP